MSMSSFGGFIASMRNQLGTVHRDTDGRKHRTDGPAVEDAQPGWEGYREWHVHGQWLDALCPDIDVLDELYDLGETDTLTHVLSSWTPKGPSLTALRDAVTAALS